MGKHVCPVCETVYAEKGIITIQHNAWTKDYECWKCPSCDYKFVSLSDMKEILASLELISSVEITYQDLFHAKQ